MGTMTYNGVSTTAMGIVIQSPPVYEFPAKDKEAIHIAGKNGDVIIDKGSYLNVKRTYILASALESGKTFVSRAKEIVAWLNSASGYARLEDSYEPEHYRMAHFNESGQLPNFYDKATAIQISFDCKPQRFLKTGDTIKEVLTANLGNFVEIPENLTNFVAFPEITIDGVALTIEFFKGPQEARIATSSFVTSFVDCRGVIDTDLQECYKIDISGNITGYINDKIVLTNGFPKLYPGKNWIKITGSSLTKVSIKPRWWTL